MKKKGLIISTIVMVVVLVASLTTATYAWFSTSSVTKINDFSVSVVSNSLVKVGFKNNMTHGTYALSSDAFYTGSVSYSGGTEGVLGGTWSGSTKGLSATLTPSNLKWGAQSKAVGLINTTEELPTTASSYSFLAGTVADNVLGLNAANPKIIAANANGEGTLATPALAKANNDGATPTPGNGDYVHFILGASPAKQLARNDLVILVEGDTNASSTIGILSAIHVCYRYTLAASSATQQSPATTTKWVDVDIFGDDPSTGHHQNDQLASLNNNWSETQQTAFVNTYAPTTTPTTGAYTWALTNTLSKTINAIDQIEIIIYIAGSDSDCIDSATGSSGKVYVFFDAAEPQG